VDIPRASCLFASVPSLPLTPASARARRRMFLFFFSVPMRFLLLRSSDAVCPAQTRFLMQSSSAGALHPRSASSRSRFRELTWQESLVARLPDPFNGSL
jgi:hypothetical protein